MSESIQPLSGEVEQELPEQDLEKLEQLFSEQLPESPIDLAYYQELASKDTMIAMTLKDLLAQSLRYTEDAAELERAALSEDVSEEERAEIDNKRTVAHNATISSIDIFARTLQQQGHKTTWKTWQPHDRWGYGKFAINVTLNRFKESIEKYRERIVAVIAEKIVSSDLDLDKLRTKDINSVENLVIRYVEVLAGLLKNKGPKDTLSDVLRDQIQHPEQLTQHNEELQRIKSNLGKNDAEILSAFYRIYNRRYE